MATVNPAAIVKDNQINVLHRAEQDRYNDSIGGHTSRIGLAVSKDGKNYHTKKSPIFYLDNDDQKKYEWIGGTEDPPPVLTDDGIVVLYNAGNSSNIGVKDLGNRVYTSGQALFSADEPWKLLNLSDTPLSKIGTSL